MKTLQTRILKLSLFAILIAGAAVLYAAGSGKQLPVTGQTTVHTANDDGTYQTGTSVPSTRFSDNGDGTVTDNMTGLMWVKNANAIGTLHKAFDADGAVVWSDALSFVAAVNSGTYNCGVTSSYTDWHLPTVHELETLVNYAQNEPYKWLNAQGFTNVKDSNYWSSTTYAPNTACAWSVKMSFGNVGSNNKTNITYVWPVRSAAAD